MELFAVPVSVSSECESPSAYRHIIHRANAPHLLTHSLTLLTSL